MKIGLAIICAVFLLVGGCDNQPSKIGTSIGETRAGIVERTDSIQDTTIIIDEKAGDIVKPETDSIRESALEIEGLAEGLREAEQAADQQASHIESLKSELEKERDLNMKRLRFTLNTLGISCVVGVGVLVALGLFMKSKTMIAIAVACAIVAGLSFGISVYLKLVAVGSLIGLGAAFIAVVGYLVYGMIQERKAVKQVVQTAESTKEYLSDEDKEAVFGSGVADEIQSWRTKRVVKKIRSAIE